MTRRVDASNGAETIQKGTADVNGAQLYYEVAGSGYPIVLIHGNLGDHRHWDEQFRVFAETHQIIRYDVRGFGKSSLPVKGDAYSLHKDLAALLTQLEVQKAHFVGWSMGCGIAIDYLMAYPEVGQSVIAVGPWANGYESAACEAIWKPMREIPTIVRERGTAAAGDYWIDAVAPNMAISTAVLDYLKNAARDYSFWSFMNKDPLRLPDPPAVKQLERISVPTLIVTAEHDFEACREVADLLEQKVAGAQKIDLHGAAHAMHMEKPDEFNGAVLEFLDSVPVEQGVDSDSLKSQP
jgi:pimeloyl-ACP methyl ester carboxylesterase